MKKLCFAFVAALSFSLLGLSGCGGGGDNKVIEPAEAAETTVGTDEASYDKAMEEAMNNQPRQ